MMIRVPSPSIVLGSALALALLHCGGDGSGGPPNFSALLGTWSCESTTTVTVTKPSGVPEQKSTISVTLEVTKSGTSTVTIGEMGDSTCASELRVSGSSASLAAPTTCDQGGMTIKVSTARVSASGDKLTGSRSGAITGTTDTGDPLTGSVTTKIDCTRLSGPPDADGGAGAGGESGSGGGSGTGAKSGSGGSGMGAKSGSGGAGNPSSGGSAGAGDCASAPDCSTCCDDTLPDGVDALTSLLLDCACQVCATECASTLCDASNPGQPMQGDECDTCARAALDTGSTCVKQTASACRADAACAPYATCLGSCP